MIVNAMELRRLVITTLQRKTMGMHNHTGEKITWGHNRMCFEPQMLSMLMSGIKTYFCCLLKKFINITVAS